MTTSTLDASEIALEVRVTDPAVLQYLRRFEPAQHAARLAEVARIGILALNAASGGLDSRAVEDAFKNTELRIKQELQQLLRAEVGPGSKFTSALDFNQKESAFAKMEAAVAQQLSLDNPISALNRLKTVLEQQLSKFAAEHQRLLGEVKQSLGELKGHKQMAEASPVKGEEFEAVVYPHIVRIGQGFGDVTADVSKSTGTLRNCKIGDFEAALAQSAAAPGKKIVFECKKDRYSLKQAQEELQVAKQNRAARFGVMIFAKGYEPAEVGEFRIIDRDIYCTVDESAPAPVYLEAAYRIARACAVIESTAGSQGLNVAALDAAVKRAMTAVERLGELKTRAETAKKAVEDVVAGVQKSQDTLLETLRAMENEIDRGRAATGSVQ